MRHNAQVVMPNIVQMILLTSFMVLPVLLLPFVQNILHAGNKEFSMLEALFSMGAIIGGFSSPILQSKIGFRSTILILLSIMAVALILFAFNTNMLYAYFLYVTIGFSVSGWALITTYTQLITDNAIQGRIQATFYGISGAFVVIVYLGLDYLENILPISMFYLMESVIVLLALLMVFYKIKNIEK